MCLLVVECSTSYYIFSALVIQFTSIHYHYIPYAIRSSQQQILLFKPHLSTEVSQKNLIIILWAPSNSSYQILIKAIFNTGCFKKSFTILKLI
jgi:hypothetical protein